MHTIEEKLLLQLIAVTVILGVILGYFLYSMIRQFRHYRQLQDAGARAKIEALEQERQLISADLHDDMGPLLSAILFKLDGIQAVECEERKLLQESRQHVNSIYSRLRDLSSMLVPRSIERKGPFYALEEFYEVYKSAKKIELQIKPVVCKGLSAFRSLHVFRMLQEILHNAIRHSGALKLTVTGEVWGNKLVIKTADNGAGFDLHGRSTRQGLGLENLSIRAKMIDATLRMESSPGAGTRHTIELYLSE